MIEIDIAHRLGAFSLAARIVAAGRVLALCGASGAGKTTVLTIVAGLMRPAAGRIVVDGATFLDTNAALILPARTPHRLCLPGAAAVPHFSVAQNLGYGQRFTPSARRFVDYDAVIGAARTGSLAGAPPGPPFGGEKQRVAIGRALLVSPRLLLMDEPLAALDDPRRMEILSYIEKMRDAFAIPIVFVSHRISEVERLASDIAVLDQGRLVELRVGGHSSSDIARAGA